LSVPASGPATQAMCAAETYANCWKHFSHDRAEGFDQTLDLQDPGSTRLRIYKTQDLDSESTRLRIYKTCLAYGTVTQHVVSTTYTTVVSAKQLRAAASGIKWGRQQ